MARLLPFLVGAAFISPGFGEIFNRRKCEDVAGEFYQFSAKTLNGSETINFEDFRGKSGCEYIDTDFESDLFYSPKKVGDIHWNFEKFLIDKEGKPCTRYHPADVDTENIVADIDTLLNALED